MRWIITIFFVSSCYGQNLKQYLSLTDAQAASIVKLNSDYGVYVSGEQSRLNTINQELAGLYKAGSPDPTQLGPRYVEIEAIRRDMAAHLSALQGQVAAQLTAAQAGLVQMLSASITLQALVRDATCAYLIDPQPNPYFISTSAIFATRTGAFAPVTLPYVPPAPVATFCGSSEFPISVRQYLSITDSQVAALVAASASYNDYYAKQQDQIADLDVNIRDETAKPSPDPSVLGTYYSELAAVGQSIQHQGAAIRQQARGLLSPQQMATLKTLQDSAALQPIVSQGESCNLVVPPPGSSVLQVIIGNPFLGPYNACTLQ